MSTPSLLSRRAATVCFSCRRNFLRQRQFSTTPAALVAAFQAYTLPSNPPPGPRNVTVPNSSLGTPIESPTMPRFHETRPPKQAAPPGTVSEKEAQQSKPEFAATPSSSSSTTQPPSSTSQEQQKQTAAQTKTPPPPATAAGAAPQTTPPTPAATTTTKSAPGTARPRSRLRARKAAINLTPSAIEHLRALLDQPDPKLIKVGVRNRGCSGLAYHLEFVDKPGAFDEAVEQDGVKVLIDSKALFSILGSEMDWVEDKLSQRFVFRNPNIKEQCGCGESFMV